MKMLFLHFEKKSITLIILKLLKLFYQIGQVIMIIESSSIEEVKDVMEGLDRIVYLIEKEKMMKEVK